MDLNFFQYLNGRCHDNQFCFVPDSFAQSRSISGSAGPIFTIFDHIVDIEWQMINPIFIFRYLKGRCQLAMATNLVAKMGQNCLPPALIAVIQKRYGITPCMCKIIFATKLVAMATSLKISKKEGRIDHLPFNIYHMVQRLWKLVQRILRYFGSEQTNLVRKKLVAMATSLKESEKMDLIKNIHANTFHLVKRTWKSIQWVLR